MNVAHLLLDARYLSKNYANCSSKEVKKMKNNSIAIFLALSLAIFLLPFGCSADKGLTSSANISATSEPVRVAAGFALSGDESSLDLPAANGAKLAAKGINAAGGVLGRPLELIVSDSEYRMEVAAQIARQFITRDDVTSGIGFTDSNSVLAAAPAFQEAGRPFITVGATSPRLPPQIGDMIYLACFGDNTQAAAGAEYAAGSFGENAYLLGDNDVEYTMLLARYFKSRFIELGGTILLEDNYTDSETDFSAQISRIKALPKQPDFYYIASMPYNIGRIVRQLREAGITGPIIGGDGDDTPDLVNIARNASDNVFFTTHAFMDAHNGTEHIRKFIASYNKEYGHDPENAFAALGYDTMNLIADAINRAGSTDPMAICEAIQDTRDFPGITGNVSYPDGSHVPRKSVTIIAVRDGKLTLAAVLTPERVPAQ
jgi:branched-chain amino acid transport system substrate-binding protein